VREVLVDDEGKQATVIVPDDQLSLAIGREGQNARLAARLTGWRIDIRSETEFATEEAEQEYEEEAQGGRCHAILANGRRCPNAALAGSRYCGLPAHQALTEIDSDEVTALSGGGPAPAEAEPSDEAEAEAAGEAEAEAPDAATPEDEAAAEAAAAENGAAAEPAEADAAEADASDGAAEGDAAGEPTASDAGSVEGEAAGGEPAEERAQ
jgi:N utilization substance protein A